MKPKKQQNPVRRKRAMTSAVASDKKTAGHKREDVFAELIKGMVNKGDQKAKKDVIDQSHRTHSVKGGTYWQIFLYSRTRLESNTMLQGIGDVAEIAIECIDCFPDTFDDYQADKQNVKMALQVPMRKLCAELKKPRIYAAFIQKAFFNGDEVDYLSIESKSNGKFHIFESTAVVDACKKFSVENSKAVRAGSTADLKVLLKLDVNIGEIELRNDSLVHYKEFKFRINGEKFLEILQKEAGGDFEERGGIIVYGKARKTFKKIN